MRCIGGTRIREGVGGGGEGLQHINVCQPILISYLAGLSVFICYEED